MQTVESLATEYFPALHRGDGVLEVVVGDCVVLEVVVGTGVVLEVVSVGVVLEVVVGACVVLE